MKLQNFAVRGKYLEVVGRLVSEDGENPSTVYDVSFPLRMSSMSLNELCGVVEELMEDLSTLFYYNGEPSDNAIQKFEETWNSKPKVSNADAHGA